MKGEVHCEGGGEGALIGGDTVASLPHWKGAPKMGPHAPPQPVPSQQSTGARLLARQIWARDVDGIEGQTALNHPATYGPSLSLTTAARTHGGTGPPGSYGIGGTPPGRPFPSPLTSAARMSGLGRTHIALSGQFWQG